MEQFNIIDRTEGDFRPVFIIERQLMKTSFLYLLAKLAALLLAASQLFAANGSFAEHIVTLLLLGCLFAADVLAASFLQTQLPAVLLRLAVIGICMYTGTAFLPLAALTAAQLADCGTEESLFWEITAVCTFLLFLLLQPPAEGVFLTLTLLLLFGAMRFLNRKVLSLTNRCTQQSAELAAQRKKLSGIKEYVRSVRSTAALEERNRFAARIHDELGHNISGSIILLEGAKYLLAADPERAQTAIQTAADNLRGGVDSIRKALHEERPDRTGLGLSELKTMLEEFAASYNIETAMQTSGNLEEISVHLWLCIKENLTETMTNTLKHGKATKFTLSIRMYNRALRVEYRDNGVCSGSFTKGLGLEAIEERTAANGGNTLFRSTMEGFSVTTVFVQK